MFNRVCIEDTIPQDGMRLVIADAHLIILAWPENGVVKAFQGVCPHANTPLAEAEFDGTVLTCPLDFWTWDMNSGQPTHEHAIPLAEYPVKIDDGVIYIDTGGVSPMFASP
jgi:toluene monooxygenase system ferredoxin subunit